MPNGGPDNCANCRFNRAEPEKDYCRIPWFGTLAPVFKVPVECWVCGRKVNGGIALDVRGQTFGFCTNRHYVDWWKIECDDPNIVSSFLNTPEKMLGEPPDEDDH